MRRIAFLRVVQPPPGLHQPNIKKSAECGPKLSVLTVALTVPNTHLQGWLHTRLGIPRGFIVFILLWPSRVPELVRHLINPYLPKMALLFDIFYLRPDGHLIWQCAAATPDFAKVRIKILMTIERGDYVISNRKTGHKILVKADGSSAAFVEQASRAKSASQGS